MNTYSEFQVITGIFSDKKDITKCQKFFQCLKRGIILEKKAFWMISLDSIDCSLDSDNRMSKFLHNDNNDDANAI